MLPVNPVPLPIAVRAFTRDPKAPKRWQPDEPDGPYAWPPVLVFDTETTVDAVQRLLFGSYRCYEWDDMGALQCTEEGLIYADDLPETDPSGFALLQRYVAREPASITIGRRRRVRLRSRREFVDKPLWRAVRAGALIVGFNLPFDLTRIAIGVTEARSVHYLGGFSLILWDYYDRTSQTRRENRYRPRVFYKTLDSKRAFFGLGTCKGVEKGERATWGEFLDLRTLVFALTGRATSLAKAGEIFNAKVQKGEIDSFGKLRSDEDIAYNRQDVAATASLLEALRAEFDRYGITMRPARAYSPASMGKAHFDAMGIVPLAEKFQDVDDTCLGWCMATYFGGRSEVRLRRDIVPVVLCDFRSMYPTVNALMGMWRFYVAEAFRVTDATKTVQALLDGVTGVDQVLDPSFWPQLIGMALVEPAEDVLPCRAQYAGPGQPYGIGLNEVSADGALWFAIPDLVQSVLLGGKVPTVKRAILFKPVGEQGGLKRITLRDTVTVDPRRDDFFRVLIEERVKILNGPNPEAPDHEAHGRFLKIMTNSLYGITAELNRQDLPKDKPHRIKVYGMHGSFQVTTAVPEHLGWYAFPPIATVTTAGARLMLATLERLVTDARGSYAFCDTDSMAIVATRRGGLVPCDGGRYRKDNRVAIRALSWRAVRERIVEPFERLNPYDQSIVPGSILNIEKLNLASASHATLREVQCIAISAKRYALFTVDRQGVIEILKASEHGLGHLIPPVDSPKDWKKRWPLWVEIFWQWIIDRARGRTPRQAAWLHRPALSRITVTRHDDLQRLAGVTTGPTYQDGIKPANFILTAYVAPFGYPCGADPEQFHLIAPAAKPETWRDLPWIDRATGTRYVVTTEDLPSPDVVRLMTYGEMLRDYAVRPEAKSAAPDGSPCSRSTRGVLRRRHVFVDGVVPTGKESNQLDDVLHGLVHDEGEVRLFYIDRSVDQWVHVARQVLPHVPAGWLAQQVGVTPRTIKRWRNHKTMRLPAKSRMTILRALREWATQVWSGEIHASIETKDTAEWLLHHPVITSLGGPLGDAQRVDDARGLGRSKPVR